VIGWAIEPVEEPHHVEDDDQMHSEEHEGAHG
jgi:hypothetical protein